MKQWLSPGGAPICHSGHLSISLLLIDSDQWTEPGCSKFDFLLRIKSLLVIKSSGWRKKRMRTPGPEQVPEEQCQLIANIFEGSHAVWVVNEDEHQPILVNNRDLSHEIRLCDRTGFVARLPLYLSIFFGTITIVSFLRFLLTVKIPHRDWIIPVFVWFICIYNDCTTANQFSCRCLRLIVLTFCG